MSLYRSTTDGTEQIRLTNFGSEDTNPVFHLTVRVAFESTINNNMDIYVLDLISLSITRVTDAPEKDTAPTWSPDSTQLAFESFRDGNFEIYMANADGSNQIRLTNDPAGDNSPAWSPTTNEIAFVSNRFGNADILLVNLNVNISTLTTNSAPDSAPAWSPDGSMIAFKTYTDTLSDLCLIGRDGLNRRCLTTYPSDYGSPVWSPDGSKLATRAKQSNGFGINVFNLADGAVLEFSNPGIEPHGSPVWSPEGLRLAFRAQFEGDMELYDHSTNSGILTAYIHRFLRRRAGLVSKITGHITNHKTSRL
ncbi:MAG: PD40 domain-containing protein [Anaerolineales bacterium]|uniref:TolB family protein n=1 Tax=Candidatus Villigracilis proximus TaxID=3140683 RepID=UPI00313600DE|nr:PD40 domain-containing protein [Anaerolineales bacterium]